MVARPCVLVVDPSEESREVLRTALSRNGAEILEASRAEEGMELARSCQPDVIVLDLECEPARAATVAEGFRDLSAAHPASMVVLGTARQSRQVEFEQPFSQGQFLRKPYHYGPLIRKIEELLAVHEQPSARRAA